ncbi:MAG: hypothetical protein QM500_12185 [Methylococcales bacterium]
MSIWVFIIGVIAGGLLSLYAFKNRRGDGTYINDWLPIRVRIFGAVLAVICGFPILLSAYDEAVFIPELIKNILRVLSSLGFAIFLWDKLFPKKIVKSDQS